MQQTKAKKATPKSDEHPSGDPRFKMVDRTLKRFHYQQDALIEVLHTAQETFGFLEDDLLIYVARQLKLPLSWVYGVATFYHFFSQCQAPTATRVRLSFGATAKISHELTRIKSKISAAPENECTRSKPDIDCPPKLGYTLF